MLGAPLAPLPILQVSAALGQRARIGGDADTLFGLESGSQGLGKTGPWDSGILLLVSVTYRLLRSLPCPQVHGKPVCAATIRSGPGYLEIPFVATQEGKRGRGYCR